MFQYTFNWDGLKPELGERFDAFMQSLNSFQLILAQRGHSIPKAGKILMAMCQEYGNVYMKLQIARCKSPTWRQAQALMEAYQWFRDEHLTDEQAAVLDSICYRGMNRHLRNEAFKKLHKGASAEEIEDFIEESHSQLQYPQPPTVTENDLIREIAAQLEVEGYTNIRTEQPTEDGGQLDLIAERDGITLLVEGKVDLDRNSAIEALGQLFLYSMSFDVKPEWMIVYWRSLDSAHPVRDACQSKVYFRPLNPKVSKTA